MESLGFIGKWWRATQRRTDMSTLWPACKEHAETLDHARAAFYAHASNDPAWTTDYDGADLINFVNELK